MRGALAQFGEALMGAVVVIALLLLASVDEVVWEDPHQPASVVHTITPNNQPQPAREGRAASSLQLVSQGE